MNDSNRTTYVQQTFDTDWLEGGEFLTGALRLGAQNPGTTFIGYQLVDDAEVEVALMRNASHKQSAGRFEHTLRQILRHSQNSQWRHPLRFRIEHDTVYQDMVLDLSRLNHVNRRMALVNATAKIQEARIEVYAVDRHWQRIVSPMAEVGIWLPYLYSDRIERGPVWMKSDEGPTGNLYQYQRNMFNGRHRYARTMEHSTTGFMALPILVPMYEHLWQVALAYQVVIANSALGQLAATIPQERVNRGTDIVRNWNPIAEGEPVRVTAEHIDLMRRFVFLGWAIREQLDDKAPSGPELAVVQHKGEIALVRLLGLYEEIMATPTAAYNEHFPRWIKVGTDLLRDFMSPVAA